jgi:glycosyltransferase involved in cell wall biosynthesis
MIELNKPVVWTLHDEWPLTGGCHYTFNCYKFENDCSACPQILDQKFRIPQLVLKEKVDFFENAITIISPSEWLANQARRSKLFRNSRIEVIPNSVDTDIYKPRSKKDSKAKIKVNPEQFVILFGVDDSNEIRKGFKDLLSALRQLRKNKIWMSAVEKKLIAIVKFGKSNQDFIDLDIPVVELGRIEDEEILSYVYSAADIFVLPSLEDNLPNTMLEALACSTPVVAFNTGGISDLVRHKFTGYLSEKGNVEGLAANLLESYVKKDKLEEMGNNGRKLISSICDMRTQAERYERIFTSILRSKVSQPSIGIKKKSISFFNYFSLKIYIFYTYNYIVSKFRSFVVSRN